MNKTIDNNSNWSEWAKYVLLSLESLDRKLGQTEKDFNTFSIQTVKDLAQLREDLIFKIADSVDKKTLNDIITTINKVIDDLNKKTNNITNNFSIYKEEVIIPLRVKVAVLSVIMGGFSGAVMGILVPVVLKLI